MTTTGGPDSPTKKRQVETSSASTSTVLDVSLAASPFRAEISSTIERTLASGGLKHRPKLVGFLANGDVAAKKYAEWTSRACKADGIEFELRECAPNDLELELKRANEDEAVHGIMVYYPCFGSLPSFYGGSMDDYIRDCVAVEKDVEGLCMTYRRNLYRNVRHLPYLDGSPSPYKSLLPCTPLAIIKVLEHLKVYDHALPVGEQLRGRTITVVNRSEIVGRPVAAMLANDGAEVFSVDVDSVFLMRQGKMVKPEVGSDTAEACVRRSQVVITGVPTPNYTLPVAWLQAGVVVINVSNFKNVNEAELLGSVRGATYVPLVGKLTVAMLERNLVRLVENYHREGAKVKVVEAGGRVVKL